MMTDPMKPLGLSFFLLTTNAPMRKAGGRLFVDVTKQLSSPEGRDILLNTLGKSDPLIKDALMAIIERGDFIESLQNDKVQSPSKSNKGVSLPGFQAEIDNDPAIVTDLIKRIQTSIKELKQNIQTKSGSDLFDFILEDIQQLKKSLSDPQSMGVILAAMNALSWINEKMEEWLGEKNAADTLSQSVPNNITSEMGLALMDVADVIRPYPEVIEYLQHAKDDHFLDELVQFHGGRETRDAISAFLGKYGMRCPGEIDITRTRWSEKPMTLVPLILNNIKNFEPNAGKRKFEQGRRAALQKEQALLERLKQLPDGEQKAEETKRMIDIIRNFSGYREYPKYAMMNRYCLYKQALLKEAEQLVQAGVIHEKEDIYYLTFEELREAVCTKKLDDQTISKRKDEYTLYEKLTPPRVITSDGETLSGRYKRENLPDGAIAGLPAVVGVENAVKMIKDGQRIRVNGTEGYIEIL
jgi:pyruvate,water dikinase